MTWQIPPEQLTQPGEFRFTSPLEFEVFNDGMIECRVEKRPRMPDDDSFKPGFRINVVIDPPEQPVVVSNTVALP